MAGKKKKSWQEKLLDDKDLPQIVPVEGKMAKRFGTGTILIPAPRMVDAVMKKVRKGRLITINEIRAYLAHQAGADFGCPITTGIFAWIAAHAAAEALAEGKKRITPYWRTLKADGEVNPKYPGGTEAIAERLRDEGHTIIQKGRRLLVQDYAHALMNLMPG